MSKKPQVYKNEKTTGLTYHWRVSIFGLFAILIPALIVYLLIGKDTLLLKYSMPWYLILPILFVMFLAIMGLILLFIYKFKWFGLESFIFFIPIAFVMLSLTATSGMNGYYLLVRFGVGIPLIFTFFPCALVVQNIQYKQMKKLKNIQIDERQKNNSLLD
ncbi:hypothetical protein [Mycoplasma phocoenae]|uniref:Uncharacterized protein n=1 Tax=Mycoplasma phocoenae TaxID=754517 RepID=A0A858U2Y2_9MOLU|nr:hypothetical protein [Mycoplasma phocoenae]QJG66830.1 hypothetical protein HGG69_00585 [Mycoplasma phocoenae]